MLKKRDGRVRIIPICERDVLDWFVSGVKDWKNVKNMSVPVINLPDDASVESVYHDPMRRRFNFFVHSVLFEPVPEGSEVPFLEPFGAQESLAVTDQTPPHVWANIMLQRWSPIDDSSIGPIGQPGPVGSPGVPGPPGIPDGDHINKCVCNGGTLACDDPRVDASAQFIENGESVHEHEADAMFKFFKGTP